MRERPILFNDAMIRAILDGRKTMLRRPVTPQPDPLLRPGHFYVDPSTGASGVVFCRHDESLETCSERVKVRCPVGAPGDLLWVKECWGAWHQTSYVYDEWEPVRVPLFGSWNAEREHNGEPTIEYRATSKSVGPWLPSAQMPRWASRLTLRVTYVRVERVQDITEEDARAEGVRADNAAVVIDADGKIRNDLSHTHRGAFAAAWDAAYGKRDPTTPTSWTENPWVWCVSFERAEVRR